MTLQEIIDQLRLCGYECEAGVLENNVAFQELEQMAKEAERERAGVLTGERIFNQLKKSQRWGANNQPSIYLVTAVLEQLPLRYLSVARDRIQFSVSRDLISLELWSLDKLTPDVVRRDDWDFDLWWD